MTQAVWNIADCPHEHTLIENGIEYCPMCGSDLRDWEIVPIPNSEQVYSTIFSFTLGGIRVGVWLLIFGKGFPIRFEIERESKL